MPPINGKLLLIAFALVIGVRVSYLNHPVQGDDYYYLASAMHGQIDPLHPNHARYVFQGKEVDMRGHTHPPLNSWVQTAILRASGEIRESTFHAVYIVFSLMILVGAYWLARRFSPQPEWALLLMALIPAFLVNGNSLEADIPFVAFWTLGIAAFICGPLWLAVPLLACAGLGAYQSAAAVPILWLYLWLYRRTWIKGYLYALTPLIAIGLFQLWELRSSGVIPLAMATGYFDEYGLQNRLAKTRNAQALLWHFVVMASPLLLLPAIFRRGKRLDREDGFLLGWTAIFFVASLALFYAGSARYLLPLAPPLVIWLSRRLDGMPRLLTAGAAVQLVLGLFLMHANFDHWQGYRTFVNRFKKDLHERRVWINGEWGLRYYAEAEGALPLEQGQAVQPGDMILTSQLAFPIPFTTGGGALVPVAEQRIIPALPVRLIGLGSKSAWSVAANGLRPFDISSAPVDIVRAEIVVERQPTLAYLKMAAPDADQHIVNGLYQVESERYRWTTEAASVLLKSPGGRRRVQAVVFIAETAPVRKLWLELDGGTVHEQTFPAPGRYTVQSVPVETNEGRVSVALKVDKTFRAPGDTRTLGIIVQELGLVEP